ncbi:MAG: hypothetical protein CVU16_07640 [Betaproteobacteria bacterium HGW-Betaproteobacteria-10]|nr:MAG: hypothetical protein CVU16_07640 [Betaproteobacteria bacterium HGW-Betaproteobacteria-10]
MSGFENYDHELAELDHEIRHYAAICGVNLAQRHEIDACLRGTHGGQAEERARENLRGLLILRIKVETEMIELGFSPPPLIPPLPVED